MENNQESKVGKLQKLLRKGKGCVSSAVNGTGKKLSRINESLIKPVNILKINAGAAMINAATAPISVKLAIDDFSKGNIGRGMVLTGVSALTTAFATLNGITTFKGIGELAAENEKLKDDIRL